MAYTFLVVVNRKLGTHVHYVVHLLWAYNFVSFVNTIMPIEMAHESTYLQAPILVVLTVTGIQGMFS